MRTIFKNDEELFAYLDQHPEMSEEQKQNVVKYYNSDDGANWRETWDEYVERFHNNQTHVKNGWF